MTLEERARFLLTKDAEGDIGDSEKNPQTLRMPSPDWSFRDVDRGEAPGKFRL